MGGFLTSLCGGVFPGAEASELQNKPSESPQSKPAASAPAATPAPGPAPVHASRGEQDGRGGGSKGRQSRSRSRSRSRSKSRSRGHRRRSTPATRPVVTSTAQGSVDAASHVAHTPSAASTDRQPAVTGVDAASVATAVAAPSVTPSMRTVQPGDMADMEGVAGASTQAHPDAAAAEPRDDTSTRSTNGELKRSDSMKSSGRNSHGELKRSDSMKSSGRNSHSGSKGSRRKGKRRQSKPAVPRGDLGNLPVRSGMFVGREDVLSELTARLASQGDAPTALVGIIGAGKTTVALEYAYRHRDEYDLVWMVRAASSEHLQQDVAALAEHLGVSFPNDPAATLAAIRGVLETKQRWLIIADGVTGASQVTTILPSERTAGQHTLATSRNLNWPDPLTVTMLPPGDAERLLLSDAGLTEPPAPLLKRLRGHVASVRALASLLVDDVKPAEQITLLDILLAQGPADYPVLSEVFAAGIKDMPYWSRMVLDVLAFLDAARIPLALIWGVPPDNTESERALIDLKLAGCVVPDSPRSVQMPVLLQETLRHGYADAAARKHAIARSLKVVKAAWKLFKPSSTDSWQVGRMFVRHAETVLSWAQADKVDVKTVTKMTKDLGIYYLNVEGRIAHALEICAQWAEYTKTTSGEQSVAYPQALLMLGRAQEEMGQFDAALDSLHAAQGLFFALYKKAFHNQALNAQLRVLLAEAHLGLGDTAKAEENVRASLSSIEAASRPDSRIRTFAVTTLARIMIAKKKASDAMPLLDAAIEYHLKNDPNAPTTCRARAYRARALRDLGHVDLALAELVVVLEQLQRVVGVMHPTYAMVLHTYAMCLGDDGDAPQAREAASTAVAVRTKIFGTEHCFTRESKDLLASLANARNIWTMAVYPSTVASLDA